MKYTVVRYYRTSLSIEVEADSAQEALKQVHWESSKEEIDQLLHNMDEVERNAFGNDENVGIVF